MSDAQFDAFKASYESSTAIGLFDNHAPDTQGGGTQVTPVPGLANSKETPEQKRSRLEGIVSMHQRSMPQDQVEKTPSWIELQALNAKS